MYIEEVDEPEETSEDVIETDDDTSDESDADVIEKSLINSDDEDDADSDDEKKDSKSDDDGSQIVYDKPSIEDIMGDGAEFDETLWEEALPLFKKAGLTQDEVNERVRHYAQSVKQNIDNHGKMLVDKYHEIKDGWRKESMETFRGEFKGMLKHTGTAIKKFGSKELLDLFDETGVGNHKAVLDFCSKVGKYFAEDNVVDGDPVEAERAEDVLYPTMKK